MRHCFGFNAIPVLECKADYLQPVNDITGKPTLIASLYLTLHAVSKVFEAFMFLFFMIVISLLKHKEITLCFKPGNISHLHLQQISDRLRILKKL